MIKILLCFLFCSLSAEAPSALVTIPPYRFLVNRIAGDAFDAYLLIPPGANLHTYEPTPKQVMGMSGVDVMFRIGEPIEEKVIPALKNYNKSIRIVDLREGVDLLSAESGCAHCKAGCDIHFWLSPKIMKKQAQRIAQELALLDPDNRPLFLKNLTKLEEDLDQLDRDIAGALAPLKNRNLFVSHPAYGYFSRHYNLTQHSIEFEGKDPTPKQLTKVLEKARELGIKTIFTQTQFSSKGAQLIAKEIGAKVVELDPYPENYLVEIKNTAVQFSEQ